MMEIIFLLLLSYSFCEEAYEFQKYGSIQIHRSNGMVYLNIETFEDDSKIYIRFNVYNSIFSKTEIGYDFTNLVPNYNFSPSKKMKYYKKESSDYSDGVWGPSRYYYKFTKQSNMKYLVLEYWDFHSGIGDSYLEIENIKGKEQNTVILNNCYRNYNIFINKS